jgi:hypothetical protein
MADTFNKRFSSGDVFTIPYEANKQWIITSSLFPEYNVFSEVAVNPTTNNIIDFNNDNLVYKSLLANFYNESYPTLTLSTSSYYQTVNYTSSLTSTDYAVSGALRIGNPATTIKDFPTEPGSEVYILNVPTSLYSNRLLPTTVELEIEGGYKIYDDGEYNLFWSGSNVSSSRGTLLSQSSYVGNVFYEQGLIVLTYIPDVPASIIPMINTLSITNETCAAANNGIITVITINGSGNFSYELVGITGIQSSNIFNNLNQGSYTVKVYDNDTGDVNTLPATVGNDNLSVLYSFSLGDVIDTVVVDDQYYKWTEEIYELVISPPLPAGSTAVVTFESYTDFSTNYRSPSTYRSYTRTPTAPITNAIPLQVFVNGVNQTVNSISTTGTTPVMPCDPTNTFQKLQETRRCVVTVNAGDNIQISNRNIISTPNPSPNSLCQSEAYFEITNTITTVNLTAPCGTRVIENNTRYNNLYIN